MNSETLSLKTMINELDLFSKKIIIRSKVITQQLKTRENPNNVDIKSIIIEHPKTSPK